MDLDEVLSVDSCRDMEELINFCTNLPLNWYKLLIKTLSSALKTILHNAPVTLSVTWTTRHFNHFTSEHYKVSKSDVRYLGKLYLQLIFESADYIVSKIVKFADVCYRAYSKRAVQPICAVQDAICAVQNEKLCSPETCNEVNY